MFLSAAVRSHGFLRWMKRRSVAGCRWRKSQLQFGCLCARSKRYSRHFDEFFFLLLFCVLEAKATNLLFSSLVYDHFVADHFFVQYFPTVIFFIIFLKKVVFSYCVVCTVSSEFNLTVEIFYLPNSFEKNIVCKYDEICILSKISVFRNCTYLPKYYIHNTIVFTKLINLKYLCNYLI